jgi:hypothetical protein
MVFSRGNRAPRCDRCGRILAPYDTCRMCSTSPRAAAKPAAEGSLEALIAQALPDTFEAPGGASDAPAVATPAPVEAPVFQAAPAPAPVFAAPAARVAPARFTAPAAGQGAPVRSTATLAPAVGPIDDILSPVATVAGTAVAVDDREPPAPVSTGFYDPEDFAIPRDPDVFVGGGGHRRRRLF